LTRRYGPCAPRLLSGPALLRTTPGVAHEYVDHFEEAERAAAVLAFYEASLNRDEDVTLPLLRRFPTWPVELFMSQYSDLFD